jgi:hypothetical protein
MGKTTPNAGTAEWKREQDEIDRREREINQRINSICRGC